MCGHYEAKTTDCCCGVGVLFTGSTSSQKRPSKGVVVVYQVYSSRTTVAARIHTVVVVPALYLETGMILYYCGPG